MTLCSGKRKNGQHCGAPLLRCKKCGAVGCSQSTGPDACSNQNFARANTCKRCGCQSSHPTV